MWCVHEKCITQSGLGDAAIKNKKQISIGDHKGVFLFLKLSVHWDL